MGSGVSKSRPSTAKANAPKPANAGAALGAVLSGAGITKVILIRHANAQPRDPAAAAVEAGTVLKPDTPFANAWTVGDLTRGLTPKGIEQANGAKAWLDQYDVRAAASVSALFLSTRPRFTHSPATVSSYLSVHLLCSPHHLLQVRAVIASEATRAIATKDVMTADGFPKGGPGMLTLHTLHPSRSGTPECEKMFDKIGYATLDTYYADRSVEGCEGRGQAIFRHYMKKVTGELHELISGGVSNFPTKGNTIAVFGHAVFLNAVAVAVAEAMAIPEASEQVGTIELGEAQGILCDGESRTITLRTA